MRNYVSSIQVVVVSRIRRHTIDLKAVTNKLVLIVIRACSQLYGLTYKRCKHEVEQTVLSRSPYRNLKRVHLAIHYLLF